MTQMRTRWLVAMAGVGVAAMVLAVRPTNPGVDEAATAASGSEGRSPAARPGAEAMANAAWSAHRLMVTLHEPADAATVAAAHGARLVRRPGPSGIAAFEVAEGASLDALRASLEEDERVRRVERMGRVYGAGRDKDDCDDDEDDDGSAGTARDYQWHLDAIGVPDDETDLSGVVVAVLDTGVAYETHDDGTQSYVQIPSLASVSFVSPYDFVNADEHPNDDNQHGTHVACLIACDGDVQGVAPGATLMPVKVLDADNSGDEIDLIDAIQHAVDNGADIINMSLAFTEGYVPSESMREALEEAAAAGVLMVAAAGNQGDEAALYPAASPLVMGVGATSLDRHGDLDITDYSNPSTVVDVMAPGGNLEDDHNDDGYVDGILAETIDPDDVSSTGYWFYAGTSQATALVAGAAAHLVNAGLDDPQLIAQSLEYGSDDDYSHTIYRYGTGAGNLNIEEALDAIEDGKKPTTTEYQYSVAILPYLAPTSISGKYVKPTALLTALDDDGDGVSGLTLIGSIWGSGGRETFKCKTDSNGECTVQGARVSANASGGTQAALAWGFAVDAAVPKTSYRVADAPGAAFFVTDALVLITEALDAEGLLEGAPLAIGWEAGTDEDLGRVANAYAITDLVAGSSTRSQALLFTPTALDSSAVVEEVELDLDALGLTDAEVGTVTVTQITLSGSGLTTDTLSLTDLRFIVLKGSGLTTDTLSFKPSMLLSFGGAGLTTDTLSFSGQPVLLGSRSITSGSLSGYSLGGLVAADGFVTADGYPPASGLMTIGAVGMSYDDIELNSGAIGSSILE